MKYAYNDNGILRDVVMTHPSIIFPHAYAEQFIEVPDDVESGWGVDGEQFTPPPVPPAPPAPSQFELDQARYTKRAAVKNDLIAYMAADNMGRVRSGAWTVPQLMSLMDDPAVASANAYMSTLSFELAAQAIATAATPLLTPEIRADWVGKLQANFYLEG